MNGHSLIIQFMLTDKGHIMNSAEFKNKCNADSFAKYELKSIFTNIRNMNQAKAFDELSFYYNTTDYYRHGLWAYFCGMSDTESMTYCAHLISVLSKIYEHNVDRLYKGAEK